jgi:hypothetical protein
MLLKRFMFFIACSVCFIAQAQKNPYGEVSISSPNAASLGKYADIPVSYHTGIPQVSLPIYSVQEGPLSLPVSISYHAGGIKVMEPASSVGAGWSLSAGGVITRTVMGAPDEKGTSNVDNHSHGYFSDYGFHSYLYEGVDNNGRPFANWTPFTEGKKDGEPDLFFFNFAGYSGKFYFHDDRTPVLVPEQDVKIEYSYPVVGESIAAFTITTPDGTKYYFGRTSAANDVDPVEITNPTSDQSGLEFGTVISSWYLNKIVSADNNFSISLTYEAENYAFHMLSMFPINFSPISGGQGPNFNYPYEYRLIKNIVNGVRLSHITFSNGQVNFIPGALRQDLGDNSLIQVSPEAVTDEARTVGAIEITNNGDVCRKFNFTYNYFEDNTSDLLSGNLSIYGNSIQTDKKRLKLISVQEQSCNGAVINPPHIFEYFTDAMPRRLSFGQDHWGFYNGVNSNQTLIPTYTTNNHNIVTGANRNSSFPAMRAGALKKITYPTGGFSEFEFEAHKTWISYPTYSTNVLWQASAGYGSPGMVTIQQPITLEAGDYKLSISGHIGGGSVANLTLNNSSNIAVAFLYANPGVNAEQTFNNIPAGQYTIAFTKDCSTNPAGVTGATPSIGKWITGTNSENETVGGLRIKKITHNDGVTTKDKITEYNYTVPGDALEKSTGILYSKPVYVQVLRNDLIKELGYWNPATGFNPSTCGQNGCLSCGGTLEYYKSPSSIRPMETTQGGHIGYSEVNVKETGNGRSTYRYYGTELWNQNNTSVAVTNVNTLTCETTVPNYPAAPLSHNFKRGELQYEAHYNEAGNLLKSALYIPVYADNPRTTPAFTVTSRATSVGAQYLGTYYKLTTGRKTQTTVTETTRTPAGDELTTTKVSFNGSIYHNQPTLTTSTVSDGISKVSKVKYAFDFRIDNCEAISDCQPQLTANNSTCLTTYNNARLSCNNGPSNELSYCLTTAYNNYMHCQTVARNTYVNCRKLNFTNATNAYATCRLDAKNNADASLKPVLELQSVFNNAPVEMTEWKDDKLLSATFNQYNYATGTANVYPDKMYVINLAAPSATFSAAANTNTVLSKDSRYTEEAVVIFSQGNLVEVKGKTGITTSYIWGVNNTVPIVKASGVNYATLKTAYDAVSGDISQLRSQPSLAPAMVSTYTYTPLVGMTSEADVNGRKISYEYDALQRLRLIRDKDNNILKQFSYGYQAYTHTNAVWQPTGNTRCKPCPINNAYSLNELQAEERDVNPESASFNTPRWVDLNQTGSCVLAAWQNTSTPVRCKTVNGQNTGEQEQEQKDMNPCSPTYDVIRWVVTGINETACPVPVVYARLAFNNPTVTGGNEYADIYISFYEDQACTIPVSLTDLNITIREEIFNEYYATTGNQFHPFVFNGTSQLLFGHALLRSVDPYGFTETHDFYIVAGRGYQPGN